MTYFDKSAAPKINLRIEPGLMAEIRAAAKENGRSLNAEIAIRLKRSLETYRR